jgi:hypothetical protein
MCEISEERIQTIDLTKTSRFKTGFSSIEVPVKNKQDIAIINIAQYYRPCSLNIEVLHST